ncbi:MAG: ABC transporter permease [Neisseriaceae bacterium]|nr:ABC transporter permease [Neisseriaceae bacterium]
MLTAFWGIVKSLLSQRRLFVSLVKNDFRSKYITNFLGVLWAFIQPTITILIFWFVFEQGFRSGPVGEAKIPFVLWLISGLIPWFYIAESLGSTSGAIRESAFLVKKMVFQVSLLPLVKQCSALIVHLFFVCFMLLLFVLYGYKPNVYWLQLIYYIFCATVLLIGIGLFTSSVVIFFSDVAQIVTMVVAFGFWLTPIFWNVSMVPETYRWLFEANPAYYITHGFRLTLIDGVWFWTDWAHAAYFWGVTLAILFLGAIVFKKLRPHFSDAL